MTAQIPDSIEYADAVYDITDAHGAPLFDPKAHGLRPEMMHTACRRGFYVTYALFDNHLVLRDLTIQLPRSALAKQGGAYPAFQGVECATKHDDAPTYSGLSLPVPFTGGMVIGDGFLHEYCVHGGFQRAWKYQRVHELTFRAGALEEARDCSAVPRRLESE